MWSMKVAPFHAVLLALIAVILLCTPTTTEARRSKWGKGRGRGRSSSGGGSRGPPSLVPFPSSPAEGGSQPHGVGPHSPPKYTPLPTPPPEVSSPPHTPPHTSHPTHPHPPQPAHNQHPPGVPVHPPISPPAVPPVDTPSPPTVSAPPPSPPAEHHQPAAPATPPPPPSSPPATATPAAEPQTMPPPTKPPTETPAIPPPSMPPTMPPTIPPSSASTPPTPTEDPPVASSHTEHASPQVPGDQTSSIGPEEPFSASDASETPSEPQATVPDTDSDESSDTSKPPASTPSPDPAEDSSTTPSSENSEVGVSVAVESTSTHSNSEPSDYESLLSTDDDLTEEEVLAPEAGPAPEEEAEYEETGHGIQDSAEEDPEVDQGDLEEDSSEVDEVDESDSTQGGHEYGKQDDVENNEEDTNSETEDYADGDGDQKEGRTASSSSRAQYWPGEDDHDDVGQQSEGGKLQRLLRKASKDPRVLFGASTGHAPGVENKEIPEKDGESDNEPDEEEAQVPEKGFPVEGDLSEYDTNDTDDDYGKPYYHDDTDDYENTDLLASEPLGVPPPESWDFDTEPVPHK